jgi:peptidyl-prolyl cis-trans isomerase C
MAAEDLGANVPQGNDAQKRDFLVSYLVDLKLGAKAAEAAKIAEDPDFARRLAYAREKLLLDEYLSTEGKKAVTPEAARKLYEDTVKSLPAEKEAHARHILLPTEDEAKAAAARIKGGEDFAKVAAELSKDPGSGKEGGDLGWFTKDRMVPEFSEAAFKLQPGQVSDPVKSQFGWHVIKLEELRDKPVPAFDQVKDQVEQYLTRKTQSDIVLGLRSKAKIERLDQPAAPAAPADGAKAADAPAAPADAQPKP